MNYALVYRADLGSAHSPFRVVAQPTGREVGWINRFLDQCCVRGLAWHTLRGYAFDLTHFIRWWADRHSTDEVTEQALTTSSLLDYMRYQAEQQPRPAATTINTRVWVECVDLSFDCLCSLAPGQWALHVPLGKLNTEHVVPIDDSVCQLVHRLRFFRFLSPVPPDGLLLARQRNRSALLRELRTALTQVRTALGITRPIVPHMFRHTFATEMMRSGVSFPALMNLLGHSTPKMTLLYSEFTQTDLQREFRAARSQPRHLVPPPRAAASTIGLKPDLISTLHALQVAHHVMEMFRRTLSETSGDSLPVLDRLLNRLTKIGAELRNLAPK